MDIELVELLRSVCADSGEQAQEITEVQDILLSNRIKVLVVKCVPTCRSVFFVKQGRAQAGARGAR